ncbi:hypothetical protein GCM10008174_18720 [Methylopila turkensis]|uniref:Uncharacterized protein n=1 Tax=Methylopila turkensis TaxID=1437816 RepID=A0A9W6JM27_9HYPH|nr:hypothetical protein GCM10008174_18720 [Methylopila turkensis]
MSADQKTVLCGKCKIGLEGPTDPKPESVFSCPRCGEGDKLKNIHRIVGEFVKEETARHFQQKLRDVARRSKFLQFKGNTIPKRSHRFVVDLKL